MFESLWVRLPTRRQSLTWHVVANAGWASAAMPVNVLLGVVQTGMLARMLGPEGIGLLGLVMAVTTLFGSMLSLTSAETVLTFVNRSLASGDSHESAGIVRYCYMIDLLSSFVAYGALILFAGFFPQLFGISAEMKSLLTVSGLTLILSSTYWDSHALLRLGDRFQWVFYQSVVHSVLKTGLVAVLFWRRAGLLEVVWLQVLMAGFNSLLLFVLAQIVLRQMGIRLPLTGSGWWRMPRDVWQFELLGYGRSIVKSANRYVDTLMIGLMADPVQVGLFRAAKQIADQLKTPTQAFVASLYPEYSRLWFSGHSDKLRRLVQRFTLGFAAVGLAVAVILGISIDWIIRLILGPDFLSARTTALILLQSTLIVIVMAPLYSLPAAVGRAGPALRAIAAALVVQVVVMWFIVPGMGADGAAWANVAYVVTWALVLLPTILGLLRPAKDGQPAVAPAVSVRE